ncbi:hypothetical protein WR25_03419 [Diploscapter pachys]|uniref:SH2 domain-containing protein n=1 Tax=Diploscapter pachys TaxID=2018661 RepID=A0A2A2J7F1_9BILA|nr:hypothetical protein WR25_03419 [Diploscapter pachys]
MSGSSTFDPYDWKSFYFKNTSRDEAGRLLSDSSVSIGTFLLRDSRRVGDYSLSVRESDEPGNQVRHYLIELDQLEDGKTQITIANQPFPDIPSLLNHFKIRVLDKTSLLYAYRKPILETVIGAYRFAGDQDHDLSFEAGERLEILSKTSDTWWEARNALNNVGMIPANYVVSIDQTSDRNSKTQSRSSIETGSTTGEERNSTSSNEEYYMPLLPAIARVLYDRVPNAYDPTQLRIRKNQTLNVTRKLANGMLEAELDGRKGMVPFTYIRFIRPTEKSQQNGR